MPHIHTDPGQYDFTASAFIIRMDDGTPKAMLHIHKILGQYLQFGGHVELHEDPWQAITHELREEAGYDLDQLQLLQPKQRLIYSSGESIVHPYPLALQTHPFAGMPHKHTDIGFAFVATEPPRNKPAEGEATDFRILSVKELKQLKDDSIPANVREIFLFAIEECLPSWDKTPASSF